MKRSRSRRKRPLPPRVPLTCPGSLYPVWHRLAGEVVACLLCGQPFALVPPPDPGEPDAWPNSRQPRVPRH